MSGRQALFFVSIERGLIIKPDRQQDRDIANQGLTQSLKAGKKIGGHLLKKGANKLAPVLLPFVKYILVFLGIIILLYSITYGITCVLPRFISQQTNRPIIYNWGKKDSWTKEKDTDLYLKYNRLEYNWLQNYKSYYVLAGEKPDHISGSDAFKETVNEVWGEYMSLEKKRPLDSVKYSGIFRDKAEKYGIDTRFLESIAWAGSGFDAQSVSHGSCLGITGLPRNIINDYGIGNPFAPEASIEGGAKYLCKLLDRFGSKKLAAAAYRGSPEVVEKYGGIPPVKGVAEFVHKAMEVYREGEIFVPSAGEGCSIVAPKEQARQHSVPWSLMASLDKILGDPVIHGGIKRKPSPKEHFECLKPQLEWKDFELYYYEKEKITYTVTNDKGEEVEKTRTETEEYTHTVRLLTKASSYSADFTYNWGEKVDKYETDREDYYRYKEVRVPRLKNVSRRGPYYEPVRKILRKNNLQSGMDTELAVRTAMNLDPDFTPDAGIMNSLLEISWDSGENYYKGSAGEFIAPVEGSITSGYGYRRHPVTGDYSFHSGIDIGASKGEGVSAAEKGLVILAGKVSGYGNTVIIDHGDCKTLYGHLSFIRAKSGEEVEQGEVIGEVGNTGVSTGPHLHFEIRKGPSFIDPEEYLKE
ncbi:MAG: peptidoglycan DD-metalloendopeptidase family protein [Clostridiales bacterium]|nr:peptidoglycan DD-metalloendopeptidase family protein [Clostridiales bacterium]MCF8022691.1 peptidoglycan DD-metalloendopeptidase family protein [Clostridiales bacterium]